MIAFFSSQAHFFSLPSSPWHLVFISSVLAVVASPWLQHSRTHLFLGFGFVLCWSLSVQLLRILGLVSPIHFFAVHCFTSSFCDVRRVPTWWIHMRTFSLKCQLPLLGSIGGLARVSQVIHPCLGVYSRCGDLRSIGGGGSCSFRLAESEIFFCPVQSYR